MVKNLLTITENGGKMVSQITENGKGAYTNMDGYRARNYKERACGRTEGIAVGRRPAEYLRRLLMALVSMRVFAVVRCVLAVLSFIGMLGVVAAMESETVSLGAGAVICLAIGLFYLVAGGRLPEEEER